MTVEEQLIANIVAGDEASRAVYADWLDEHDRPIHAEFVRLQGAAASDARLRGLSAHLDLGWRMQIGRPIVEGCTVEYATPCPIDWGAMAPTAQPALRTCRSCDREVRYCVTEQDALYAAKAGTRVVIDAGALRREQFCGFCARSNQLHYKFCLGCGGEISASRAPGRQKPRAAQPVPDTLPRFPSIVPPQVTCLPCGASSPATHRFCNRCGARLS